MGATETKCQTNFYYVYKYQYSNQILRSSYSKIPIKYQENTKYRFDIGIFLVGIPTKFLVTDLHH